MQASCRWRWELCVKQFVFLGLHVIVPVATMFFGRCQCQGSRSCSQLCTREAPVLAGFSIVTVITS